MRNRSNNVPTDIDNRKTGDGVQRRGPGGWGIEGGLLSGSAGGVQSVFSIGLPWQDRPPTATDFQINATLAGVTAASGQLVFPGGVQLPQGTVGAIRSIGILANGLLVTSDIRWTLLFNQAAVPGWNNLTINPRAAASVELSYGPDETQIPVPDGNLIDVAVRVLDAGTYQVSVVLHGWFYSSALDAAARKVYG
jgi:hypothetical protein